MVPPASAQVLTPSSGEALWFLGTYIRVKLDGGQTEGRLGMFEAVMPRGAAPPLHSHRQDETFVIVDGEVTAWVVDPASTDDDGRPPAWVATHARHCPVGAVVYAPAGTPHTFRVESDTARMLTLSTPAGIEQFARAMSEPAKWPWLQPPADGPRVSPETMQAVQREHGMVVHGPPPPAVAF
jgi:quercetin dioxygenase-like cupin family protein